jgi:phage-related protein
MATELAKAYVQIVPSAEGISGSLSKVLDGEATSAGKSAGGKFSSAMGGFLKTGAAALAGLGTAAVGVGTALTNQAASVAAYGDNIDKMSQKMGMSAEAYQEWDAVMQHSGTSMETMKASMKTLANAAETNNKAFKELGITENDLKNMNQEQLFEATIAGLQQVDDTTQRTYLAGKLLGKGATELGALLNTSAEDTQAMRDRVHELGGVMSDEAVKNSAAFQDSLQDLQTSFAGVKNSVMSEMLPSFTSVMDGLSSLVIGEEGAKEKITTGIQGIVQNITEAMPRLVEGFGTLAGALLEVAPELIHSLAEGILGAIPQLLPTLIEVVGEIATGLIDLLPQLVEVGLQVILELAKGITEALPDLIPTIVDTMMMIVDTLIENIDLLIDAAIAIMVALAEGLIEALPRLIEKLPDIIIAIVEGLVNNVPKLLEASVQIIVALATGLIESLPELISRLPEIIAAIVTGIINLASDMAQAGKELVSGLLKGIKENWDSLVSSVTELGSKLVDKVKGFFKIGSPSKLFADEIGKWIPEGVAVGIEANADSVNGAVEDMVNDAMIDPNYTTMTQTANALTPSLASGVAAGSDNNMVSLLNQYLPLLLNAIENNQVTLEGDAKDMFRLMRKENNQFMKANGVSAFA